MSANIDTLIYVGETPWHNMGTDMTQQPPKSSSEIIKAAKLDWTVAATPATSAFHDHVLDYSVIYREDTSDVLGIVKSANPKCVQNDETFNTFNPLIDNVIDVETAASLGNGEQVFGCFKIRDQYKVLDDDIDHYFVVLNEHLKPDGRVTVLNTPVRVVCQNTLSAALNRNFYRFRVPITSDVSVNESLANNMIRNVDRAIDSLKKRAEKMATTKIDKVYVERVLDELFPYIQTDDEAPMTSSHQRANEQTSMIRTTFLNDCMGADNIANYRGTQYQVLMALTDFTQHYHRNVDKAYDINYRMKMLPGLGVDSPTAKVSKFLTMADKLVA